MSKELNNWKKMLGGVAGTAVGLLIAAIAGTANKESRTEEVILETKNHKLTRKN